MLFDPKWNPSPPTTLDPRSLESLISWLETHHPDTTYRYESISHCLLSQYFRAMGFRDASIGYPNFSYTIGSRREREDLPPFFDSIALGDVSVFDRPDFSPRLTFGAALIRARHALTLRNGAH